MVVVDYPSVFMLCVEPMLVEWHVDIVVDLTQSFDLITFKGVCHVVCAH